MNANRFLALLFTGILGSGLIQSAAAEATYLETKLKNIIVPEVEFEDTPVSQAIQFLREKSIELDDLEPIPAKKGVNVILLHEPQQRLNVDQPPSISMKARNMTLGALLRYVAQISGFKLDVHAEAVVIGSEDELRELRHDLGLENASSESHDEAPPVRIVPR